MRETSTSEGGNYYQFSSKSVIHENSLGSFTCRKAGTRDILFYFLSEGRHTEDFPDARKIQRLWPGLNPRTRVPVASMLTTRPPKPSIILTNVTAMTSGKHSDRDTEPTCFLGLRNLHIAWWIKTFQGALYCIQLLNKQYRFNVGVVLTVGILGRIYGQCLQNW